MLNILELLTVHARSWILTGNESWFYFSYAYEGKWVLARDSSMTKPNALINTRKIMVLVIWGIDGHTLGEIIPSNLLHSGNYSCEFAKLHMEANVKAHRPKQALKGMGFH
jgi:hypothetical protein